jgi:N-acetylglucosaminyldiphosphoundecaprenol N-acetyl-beta-D-mannosaminyltransferase
MTSERRRANLLGIPIDPLGMAETVSVVREAVAAGQPITHLGVNAANFVLANDDAEYRADLAAADLVTADGQSVVWAARLFGIEVPERVTGIDLMEALLAESVERGWSVYLLGAREEVVEALARRLEGRAVRVAGRHHGYFGEDRSTDVAAEIRATGATLLFVGMTTPRKERFVIHAAHPAGIPFSMGVGGSFDVLAGRVARAPRLLQRVGMEWLFRLVQEPRRLLKRYVVTNTRFLLLLVAGAARRRRPRGGHDR